MHPKFSVTFWLFLKPLPEYLYKIPFYVTPTPEKPTTAPPAHNPAVKTTPCVIPDL